MIYQKKYVEKRMLELRNSSALHWVSKKKRTRRNLFNKKYWK